MTMRTRIASLAVALVVAGIVLALSYPRDASGQAWAGGLLRVGLVMGVLWLALPQLMGLPRWLFGGIVVLLIVVARWPKLILVALAAAAVLAFIRPRTNLPQR